MARKYFESNGLYVTIMEFIGVIPEYTFLLTRVVLSDMLVKSLSYTPTRFTDVCTLTTFVPTTSLSLDLVNYTSLLAI